MIKPLTDTIKKYIRLTDKNIAEIEACSKLKTFSKGDFLLRTGDIAKEMCYVFSGVFRVYYTDRKENEVTYLFVKEEDLFTEDQFL